MKNYDNKPQSLAHMDNIPNTTMNDVPNTTGTSVHTTGGIGVLGSGYVSDPLKERRLRVAAKMLAAIIAKGTPANVYEPRAAYAGSKSFAEHAAQSALAFADALIAEAAK